jgi:hypothetical protein
MLSFKNLFMLTIFCFSFYSMHTYVRMAPLLGTVGTILEVDSDGDFRVLCGHTRCHWPPNMLEPLVGGRGLSPRGQRPSKASDAKRIEDVLSIAGDSPNEAEMLSVIEQIERLDPERFQAAIKQMCDERGLDEETVRGMIRAGRSALS